MDELDRIARVEQRQWEQQQDIAKHDNRLSSLETARDNERTRHASTPAWVFGILSVAIAAAGLLLNLYLAGLRP